MTKSGHLVNRETLKRTVEYIEATHQATRVLPVTRLSAKTVLNEGGEGGNSIFVIHASIHQQ
jgi:hypothetical protein